MIAAAIEFDNPELGLLDLLDGIGDHHIHDLGGCDQALGMLAALENPALVGPLALEDRGAVMQAVGEDMDLRILPGRTSPFIQI